MLVKNYVFVTVLAIVDHQAFSFIPVILRTLWGKVDERIAEMGFAMRELRKDKWELSRFY